MFNLVSIQKKHFERGAFFIRSREPAVHFIFFAFHPYHHDGQRERSREVNYFSEAKKDAVPIRARVASSEELPPKTNKKFLTLTLSLISNRNKL
jgi:hypothetical protein